MKLANKIQKELIRFARGSAYDIVLANYYFGSYEMDVFKLSDKRWLTEYEIKTTRADFKKDFSKQRQKHLYNDNYTDYTVLTTNKHDGLMNGDCKPNRFFFVVPEGLITIDEVPKYAGLLYFKDDWFTLVKSARLLHKEQQPLEVYRSIARSLSFREVRYRNERDLYKHEIELMRQQLQKA